MKKNIHPKYVECAVSCGCGETFKTKATKPAISVEICSLCHPFYTGKQKFVDSAGQVEKFQKKFGWDDKKVAEIELRKAPKKAPTIPKAPKKAPKPVKPPEETSDAKTAGEAAAPKAEAAAAAKPKPSVERASPAPDKKPAPKPASRPAPKPAPKTEEAGAEGGKKERKPAPKPKVVRRSPESLKEKTEGAGEQQPPAADDAAGKP